MSGVKWQLAFGSVERKKNAVMDIARQLSATKLGYQKLQYGPMRGSRDDKGVQE